MSIELTEEQKMLQDSAERYLKNSYDFDQRQAASRSAKGFSDERWAQFAEMGWLAMPLPEEHGGFGFGAMEIMLLAEQMGRYLVVEPFLETVVVGGGLLARGATTALAERYLPAVAEGQLQVALAHGEEGKHASMINTATTAVDEGAHCRLNGVKSVVANGDQADVFIVSARLVGAGNSAVTLFAIPADAEGVERRGYPTYDGRRACELTLRNVVVGPEAVVGGRGSAEYLLDRVALDAQLAACAEVIGGMAALVEATQDYIGQRKQFGKTLSSFQVLRHRMADMYVQLELTRSLMLAAASSLAGEEGDAARLISALKARTVKAGRFVSQNAIQLHGGIAMTDELSIGHYFKRFAVLESWFGNRDFHLQRFRELQSVA
ncbi:acyl-CoA dehydrogenase family protein [Parahaliea aestuarii]|nr:acyl-CoA dehydrogenase family protein [Parahaliea aestuarii]